MQRNRGHRQDYREHLSDSQNFITSRQLIRKIVGLSGIDRSDTVLEIGTGKGHLTQELCWRGGRVVSVEIDGKLLENARTRLAGMKNLELIQGDFLRYPLPERGDYKIFANIPFFITTQIIDRLTKASNRPSEIWLVVEKGAAARFMGIPKETVKSLLLKAEWEMAVRFRFRRTDFHPMPSVDTVLLHLKRRETPELERSELPAFDGVENSL